MTSRENFYVMLERPHKHAMYKLHCMVAIATAGKSHASAELLNL